jgi:hypothetical protein
MKKVFFLIPTRKTKVGAHLTIRTRTAWAVFQYCGTKTVPLRMKKWGG